MTVKSKMATEYMPNIHNKLHVQLPFRAIKMTSPSLNIFIAFGCILLYASVYVNGLDHSHFDDLSVAALCYVSITFGIHSLDIPKM